MNASTDLDALPVDPARIVTPQKRDHAPNVVCMANANKWSHGSQGGLHLRVIADGSLVENGFDWPWCDNIDADTTGAEFLCQVFGEYLDGTLHGRVGGASGDAKAGRAARNINHHSAVTKHLQASLGQEAEGLEVHVQVGVKDFLRDGRERDRCADARGMDQKIETIRCPQGLLGLGEVLYEAVETCNVPGVVPQAAGFAASDERDSHEPNETVTLIQSPSCSEDLPAAGCPMAHSTRAMLRPRANGPRLETGKHSIHHGQRALPHINRWRYG